MDIDYGRLRSVSAREIISALMRDGFTFDRGDGSHRIYYHSDGRRVTVIFHGGSTTLGKRRVPAEDAGSTIDQARWTQSDLERLKLIR